MSIREALMSATARSQRGFRVRAGDRFVRGVEAVVVDGVEDGIVSWTPLGGDGESYSMPRSSFAGRALRRIPAPPDLPGATDLLGAVWAIVAARAMDPQDRLAIVARAYPGVMRTANDAEKATIGRWLTALRTGQEPSRESPNV